MASRILAGALGGAGKGMENFAEMMFRGRREKREDERQKFLREYMFRQLELGEERLEQARRESEERFRRQEEQAQMLRKQLGMREEAHEATMERERAEFGAWKEGAERRQTEAGLREDLLRAQIERQELAGEAERQSLSALAARALVMSQFPRGGYAALTGNMQAHPDYRPEFDPKNPMMERARLMTPAELEKSPQLAQLVNAADAFYENWGKVAGNVPALLTQGQQYFVENPRATVDMAKEALRHVIDENPDPHARDEAIKTWEAIEALEAAQPLPPEWAYEPGQTEERERAKRAVYEKLLEQTRGARGKQKTYAHGREFGRAVAEPFRASQNPLLRQFFEEFTFPEITAGVRRGYEWFVSPERKETELYRRLFYGK